jgi:hypothetical protein
VAECAKSGGVVAEGAKSGEAMAEKAGSKRGSGGGGRLWPRCWRPDGVLSTSTIGKIEKEVGGGKR